MFIDHHKKRKEMQEELLESVTLNKTRFRGCCIAFNRVKGLKVINIHSSFRIFHVYWVDINTFALQCCYIIYL